MASLVDSIWLLSWLPSLVVIEQEITDLLTPHALPRACLLGMKT